MDTITRTNLYNLRSEDRETQNKAFFYILEVTGKPVDWAYEVWDEMVENLRHKDNHRRAIAAQVLCNLAKSDPKNRMLKDFDALLAVTKMESLCCSWSSGQKNCEFCREPVQWGFHHRSVCPSGLLVAVYQLLSLAAGQHSIIRSQ